MGADEVVKRNAAIKEVIMEMESVVYLDKSARQPYITSVRLVLNFSCILAEF